MFNPQHQNIYREFLAGAEMVTLDGNGRILIPRGLVDMACIKQDVKILGLGESIELWALEKYMEQRMGSEEFGKALESVMCGPVF
jgi:MraZ protein